MRTRWMLALLLAGCTDDSPPSSPDDPTVIDSQNGACTAFEGRTFQSVTQHECGLTPDGVAMCHWQLAISALDAQRSNFAWSYSDVRESGAVRCSGRQISTDGFGPVRTGTFDPATQQLTWAGVAYALL